MKKIRYKQYKESKKIYLQPWEKKGISRADWIKGIRNVPVVIVKLGDEQIKIKNKNRKPRKTPRSYPTYILSDLWKNRRNKFWRNHSRLCEACGSFNQLNVHHGRYGAYDGREKDSILFALCQVCHKEFHDTHKITKKMLKENIAFIEKKKVSSRT